MPDALLRARLESIDAETRASATVDEDPIRFPRVWRDPRDREIIALVASSLAFGNVKAINANIDRVVGMLGPAPAQAIRDRSRGEWERSLRGFRHRWIGPEAMAELLAAVGRVQREHGSLEAPLADSIRPDDCDILPALDAWVTRLLAAGLSRRNRLIAHPSRRGACKRLHLFLRWMARRDEIDPGGWDGVPARLLLVPVDVHMHRIGRWLGFTRRRQANLATVREITAGFRRFAPEDPARYDFALTRFGIRERWDARRIRSYLLDGPPA